MDVFYYWKDIEDDFENKRIGWLESRREKLAKLRDRHPDHIWAFKTPRGRKGFVSLVAKLVWCDHAKCRPPKNRQSLIYYDPDQIDRFDPDGNEAANDALNKMLRTKFPSAFRGNFQGDNGLQELDEDFLIQFRKVASKIPEIP